MLNGFTCGRGETRDARNASQTTVTGFFAGPKGPFTRDTTLDPDTDPSGYSHDGSVVSVTSKQGILQFSDQLGSLLCFGSREIKAKDGGPILLCVFGSRLLILYTVCLKNNGIIR